MGRPEGNSRTIQRVAVIVVLLIVILVAAVVIGVRKDGGGRSASAADPLPGAHGRSGTASGTLDRTTSRRTQGPTVPGAAESPDGDGPVPPIDPYRPAGLSARNDSNNGVVPALGTAGSAGLGAGRGRESSVPGASGIPAAGGDSGVPGQSALPRGSMRGTAGDTALSHGSVASGTLRGGRGGGVGGGSGGPVGDGAGEESGQQDGARFGAGLPLGLAGGGTNPGSEDGENNDNAEAVSDEEDDNPTYSDEEWETAASDGETAEDPLAEESSEATPATFSETEIDEAGEPAFVESDPPPPEKHIIADLVSVPVQIDAAAGDLGCETFQPAIPLTNGFVAATGETELVQLPFGGHYILKISGKFAFSINGYQDAARRWHRPFRPNDDFPDVYFSEPYCVSCEVDGAENGFSLLISGNTKRPVQECPFEHVYFHHIFVDQPQTITLKIADTKIGGDPYRDNKGQLTYAVYPITADHWIVQRDAGNLRLGVEVGAVVGQGALKFADISGQKFGAFFKKLDTAFPLPDGQTDVLIEVYGIVALSPGYEIDYVSRWNHVKKVRTTLSYAPVSFDCDTVEVVTDDLWAHRVLLKATGCPSTMTAYMAIPAKEKNPKAAGTFEIKVYEMP